MKKSHLFVLLVAMTLAVVGCSAKNNHATEQPPLGADQQRNSQLAENNDGSANSDLSAATSTDLAIGQRIMVLGSKSDDGGLSAFMIVIGNRDTNFNNLKLGGPRGGPNGTGDNGTTTVDPNGGLKTPQSGTNNERPNFQNMTREERAKMMAERPAGSMPPGTESAKSAQKVTGEIIKQEAGTLTIKVDDGGSKLIYLLQTTRIMRVK